MESIQKEKQLKEDEVETWEDRKMSIDSRNSSCRRDNERRFYDEQDIANLNEIINNLNKKKFE